MRWLRFLIIIHAGSFTYEVKAFFYENTYNKYNLQVVLKNECIYNKIIQIYVTNHA